MEINNYRNLTGPLEPPPIASRLLSKDPTKLIKLIQLVGRWINTLSSPSKNSQQILKAIDTHLKQSRSIIKLILFCPIIVTTLSNITHIKENILNWLDIRPDTVHTPFEIAEDIIANHIAPFFESTTDFAETLHCLNIVDVTSFLPLIQTIGGGALFIMSAHQTYLLAKRFFAGDTGGTYYLQVAKQVCSISLSILFIVEASASLPLLAPTLLVLSTISQISGLIISADKIEKEEAIRVS